MIELKEGDKFILNRLGYENQKPIEECESLGDCMGYIIITITKVNQKSFRSDYNDELLKEVPRYWHPYSEARVRKFALDRIIKEMSTNSYFYRSRIGKAKEFLTKEDKEYVAKKLEEYAYKKAKNTYYNSIEKFNDFYTMEKGWDVEIENFIQNNTTLREFEGD